MVVCMTPLKNLAVATKPAIQGQMLPLLHDTTLPASTPRQVIDLGRGKIVGTKTTGIRRSLIIRQNDDDIWLSRIRRWFIRPKFAG